MNWKQTSPARRSGNHSLSSIKMEEKAGERVFRTGSRCVPLNPKRRVRGPGLQFVGPVPSQRVPRAAMFMGRGNLQRSNANRGHEPEIPLTRPSASALLRRDKSGTLSPTGGEGWGEGASRFRERFRRKETSRFAPVNCSSRREEALISFAQCCMSLLTSAATRFRGIFLFHSDLLTGHEPREIPHGWQSRPTEFNPIPASFPIRGSALPSVGPIRNRFMGRMAVQFPILAVATKIRVILVRMI